MIGIQEYLEFHKEEIVDFVERKVPNSKDKEGKIAGEIFGRLVNELSTEMPFGPPFDMNHVILANALICSYNVDGYHN
jgi:hypothetical protein